MINTFMNIKFIFKLTHSMYFTYPNDKVYTFMCRQKLKVVDDLMHEDFDLSSNNYLKPMYTMFNVGGSFMNRTKNCPITPKTSTSLKCNEW
jgi:hypothetical protein